MLFTHKSIEHIWQERISRRSVVISYAERLGEAYNPIGLEVNLIGLGKIILRYEILNYPLSNCLLIDTVKE